MNIIKLGLSRPFSNVEVIIERKKVKNIRLKVYPNGIVKLSAPLGIPDAYISGFLESKTGWLEKSLNYFKNTEAVGFEKRIYSGMSTRILGRQVRIIVNEAKTYKVEQKEDYIFIKSPVIKDKQALLKQFERWWQKECKLYFLEAMDRLYPVIEKHGLAMPKLHVRKMKTLWGSCSKKHGKINLNYYLYKAPPACIDYVILHEMTHFLYAQHNKDFYAFLTLHMPDWKERKRILDHEVVKELGYY